MRLVIVHAGFHKTGTTTVQNTLRDNRRLLAPHLQVILRPGMVALCEAARAFSVARDPLEMALFRYELARLAEDWAPGDPRPLLLASEDLSGHMPGRRGLTGYDAAPLLMRALAETLAEAMPGARLQFFFSTRAAAPWLASCYRQTLRATRLTLGEAEYARRFRASAALDAAVDAVARAVAPLPVQRCALETSQDRPLGPLAPLLDLLDLPDAVRAAIVLHPAANAALPQSVNDRLLALNRSDLDDNALRAAKLAAARAAR